MKKILLFLVVAVTIGFFIKPEAALALVKKADVTSETAVYSVEDLSEFDGLDGHKSYTSYEGVVYDVTDSKLWKLGEHFGLKAGVDLTKDMEEAPHGGEVFTGFEVVGSLEGYVQDEFASEKNDGVEEDVVKKGVVDSDEVAVTESSSEKTPLYSKRNRPGGF